MEGFYTGLQNTFTTVSTGRALVNSVLLNEIQNGGGDYVTGINFDLGVSPSSRFTASVGGALQKTKYKEDQVLFETDPEDTGQSDVVVDRYTRTPNFYGYLSLNTVTLEKLNFDFAGTYTGSMIVPHVIDETGYLNLVDTDPYFDLNIKLSRHIEFTDNFHVAVNVGVQNVFNSYQDDFDKGPECDSDYIYGPASPRTYSFE